MKTFFIAFIALMLGAQAFAHAPPAWVCVFSGKAITADWRGDDRPPLAPAESSLRRWCVTRQQARLLDVPPGEAGTRSLRDASAPMVAEAGLPPPPLRAVARSVLPRFVAPKGPARSYLVLRQLLI